MNNKDTLSTWEIQEFIGYLPGTGDKGQPNYYTGSSARNDEFRFGYTVSHFQNSPSKDVE